MLNDRKDNENRGYSLKRRHVNLTCRGHTVRERRSSVGHRSSWGAPYEGKLLETAEIFPFFFFRELAQDGTTLLKVLLPPTS